MPLDTSNLLDSFQGPVALILATPTRWNSTFYMLQSLVNMQAPLLVCERDCFINVKDFIPTASHESLIQSEWDTVMSLLRVLLPLEVATRVLSGVNYSSLGCTFIIFHQIIRRLDEFINSAAVSSHHHLATSLKTSVLSRKS